MKIVAFTPDLAPHFDRINRAWIEHYFAVEPIDDLVLKDPQTHIIDKGGEIWFAQLDGEIIGACALKPYGEGELEFTKLGVDDKAKGKGIARALMRHCLTRAKTLGAQTIVIFTNSRLEAANRLYIGEGYSEVSSAEERARYQRCDIIYRLAITKKPAKADFFVP